MKIGGKEKEGSHLWCVTVQLVVRRHLLPSETGEHLLGTSRLLPQVTAPHPLPFLVQNKHFSGPAEGRDGAAEGGANVGRAV